jgi:hypothetical protein
MLVENGCLNILTLKITVFWNVTLCSPADRYQRFGEICAAGKQCFILVSCLSYSLTLQVEVVCSFEILVAIYWPT